MEPQPLTVEEIRSQMRAIRRDLRENVKEIVVGASQIFDWKSYVRSFPWASVAAAAVLGYLLVPRRKESPPALVETRDSLDNLAREVKAAVAPPPPPSFNLVGMLLPLLGSMAMRLGTTYLTRMGTGLLDQFISPGSPGVSARPGRSAGASSTTRRF